MTMLVFLEDLNKRISRFGEMTAIYFFNIFYYYLFNYFYGFSTNVSKMTWVVLTKSHLLRLKATFGPKICTEDVKKIRIQSYKV